MTVDGAASEGRHRVGSVALLGSSATVVAVAGAFDVLADERPLHTLSLVLVAAIVGAVRWMVRGRLGGLFVVLNLAIVVQPLAHGVTKLASVGAGMLPHSHVVPEEFSGFALQLVIALLAVVVAGSEPIGAFVAASVIGALGGARPGRPDAAPSVARPTADDLPLPTTSPGLSRCRSRRGPPVGVGAAG